jgi:hypothetical protein
LKAIVSERVKFLKKNLGKGNVFNDEVNCPYLFPAHYEESVLSSEIELSDFYGGMLYFHRCGDAAKPLPMIGKIKTIEIFSGGPRTDGR